MRALIDDRDVCAAGPKAVAKNAAIGGVLLALIEGLTVLITKARHGKLADIPGGGAGPRMRALRGVVSCNNQWTAPAPLKKEDFEHGAQAYLSPESRKGERRRRRHAYSVTSPPIPSLADPTEPPLQPGLLPPISMPTYEGVQGA